MTAKRVNVTIDRRGNVKARINGSAIPFVTGFSTEAEAECGSLVTLKIDPSAVAIDGHAEVVIDPESVEGLLGMGFIRTADHERAMGTVREEAIRGVTAQFGKDLDELRGTVEAVRADAVQAAADRDAQVAANASLEKLVAELRDQAAALVNERDKAAADLAKLRKKLDKEEG